MSTPEQLATRYHNASTKLGSITDVLESLCDDRAHGEGLATYAGSALYYLNHVCEMLDRRAEEFEAGHTRVTRNELRGTHVIYRCICGYESDNDHTAIDDHINYMLTVVGESAAEHREQ